MIFALQLLAQVTPAESEMMKDPGFQQWVVYAIGAAVLLEKLLKLTNRNPEKREVSGTIQSQTVQKPAIKDEVDKEFNDVDARVDEVDARIKELREYLQQQFEKLRDDGQERARLITLKIDTEIRAIRGEVDAKIAALQIQITQMIAKDSGHDEAIGTLKVSMNHHATQLTQIQQRMPRPKVGG